MSRPRIALTLANPNGLNEASHGRYRAALEAAGADVVALYPKDAVPDDIDGLLLSGGGDIAADQYGASDVACDGVIPERDELEIAAVRFALERDLPVLGICRGFQLLNVVRGGQLIQHLDDHDSPPEPDPIILHEVRPLEGSLLAQATGDGPQTVNSFHHQAVTRDLLGAGLAPTVEVGGIIEAFEATDRRWVLGVQWHPERKWEVSPESVAIFDAFVAAAATGSG